MRTDIVPYFHNCNSGDLIAALPGIRQIYRSTGKKAVIYQQLNHPGLYMPGLVHSVKDEKGVQVTMNQRMFDMMRPLLLAQGYVEDFQVYTDQKPFVDLAIIREKVISDEQTGVIVSIEHAKAFVGMPNMPLASWLMLAYPDMACNLAEPWIETPGLTVIAQRYILVNRTERYINPNINYSFLKRYESDLLFAGTEKEHACFCKQYDLNFPRLTVDDFLELAEIMKLCRFFLGNQSFPWNLANAMDIPRILEIFHQAPNCQPFYGEHNYGFLHQRALEYYFDLLYKKTASGNRKLHEDLV
jgi:hypothetical protein